MEKSGATEAWFAFTEDINCIDACVLPGHYERCFFTRYKHTKRRLPHAIIIGARKAGTRALLTFMNMHPQVQVAKNEVSAPSAWPSLACELDSVKQRKKLPTSLWTLAD